MKISFIHAKTRIVSFAILLFFLNFSINSAQGQNIVINEFMASNGSTISDPSGEYEDWLELYNPSNSPVNIGGMYVTDDLGDLTMWQIPNNASQTTTIPANGYLILWLDKDVDEGPLHIDLKLSSSGEDITLVASNGNSIIDSRTFDVQFEDVSEGRDPNGGSNWDYYTDPTPGGPNNTDPGLSKAPAPTASLSSGLYNNTQTVTLSTSLPNSNIYYTTDGSVPTAFAFQYTGPITISENTPLRAITVANGLDNSDASTYTYLLNVDHTFPVVNITAGDNFLFDPAIGIYPNFTQDIEIPAHVELIEPNGTIGFSQLAEIEIHGSASATIPQKSLAIKAKKSLGNNEFEYEIFPDLNMSKYRSLIVRNSGQDNNLTMFRDALVSSLVRDLSDVDGMILPPRLYTQGYRPSVVYINGEYWGIHNLRERMDKRYLKVHFDLDDDEVDFIENWDESAEGDLVEWQNFLEFLNSTDFNSDANFAELETYLDTDHYLDYLVFNVYIDNWDWPANNTKRWRERVPDAQWRFMTWDLDFSFGLFNPQGWNTGIWYENSLSRLYGTGTSWPNPRWSTLLFRKMIANEKWRNDFVNRMADQMNVLYGANRINNRIDEYQDIYSPEMPQHIDRWTNGFLLWDDHINVMKTFATNREQSVRQHVVSSFNDVFGTAEVTLNANPANGGEVKFSTLTLDNNQFPWSGTYFTGMDIPVEAVAKPGYVFTGWSIGSMGSNTSTTINLSSNISITANFSPVGNQLSQNINFPNIADKLVTDLPFQLNAFASSGLPVSYSISGPATLLGTMVQLNGTPGTVTITANQGGNATYFAATSVSRNFNVTEIPQGGNPTVVVSTSNLTVNGTFTVNIQFNEFVNNLTLAEVVVNNGTKSNAAGNGSSYSFTVTPNNFGVVSINVPAGSANDTDGNPNLASNVLEVNYLNPNSLNPTVNLSTSNLTVNGAFTVNIEFNKSVNDLTLGEVVVSNGTKSNAAGFGSSYSFTVTPNNFGIVSISLPAGSAFDTDGNPNLASNVLEVNYETLLNSNPTVNLSTASLNTSAAFTVNISFDKNVNGFSQSDIQVSNGSKSNFSGFGSQYSVLITPINNGNVGINISAGSAFDTDGNPNLASNSLSVNYQLVQSSNCNNPQNIALNQSTSQSSIAQNGFSSLAVDGNMDGDFWTGNSVALTGWNNEAWWQVDLGEESNINEIRIWNREDCCYDKLSNFYVLVSNNPFSSTDLDATLNQANVWSYFQSSTVGRPTTIPINQQGRYIRLQAIDGRFLGIAEVEVMGCNNGGGTSTPPPVVDAYCDSYGQFQNQEWIQTFALNDLFNASGNNNGYADFTNLSTTLQAGQTYQMVLNPGHSNFVLNEHWRVWIDYNQDGDFFDLNEKVFDTGRTGSISTEITIPQQINTGPTRMRVSMRWGSSASSCDVFTFGEVEDYTVNLSGGVGAIISLNQNILQAQVVEKGLEVEAYPNPVEQFLIVDYTTSKEGDLHLSLLNIHGVAVLQKEQEVLVGGDRIYIDLANYPAGTYTLFVKQGGQQKALRIVKIRD